MADLAIGISTSVVEKLVNKVKSAVKEEAEKWQILHRDIVFIKDEFEMMKSFLNTTGGQSMKNQVARTWVRQVRDLSYDTEDCIELVLHLDTKRAFWQYCRLLKAKVSPKTSMLLLDQAVAEIKQIKAQAEDVNQRYMRYSFSLTGRSGEQMLPTPAASCWTPAFVNHTSILDLSRWIKREGKDLQVIMVCGTGVDLGTISINKKAYDEPEICQRFERRAWVKLMHPFNPHVFIQSLLVEFYINSLGQEQGEEVRVQVLATMKETQDNIFTDFMEKINEKPYLIVVEDLSSVVEWNAIKMFLPDMKTGSRVIVSTQQLEIASLCTGQPHHVWLLRHQEEYMSHRSVYAFSKKHPELYPQDNKSSDKDKDDCNSWELMSPSHWLRKHGLLGRDSELKKLEDLLNISTRVISVWGIAGAGKSFLVEALYEHYSGRYLSRAMIHVLNPFDIMDFCEKLVHEFNLTTEDQDIFQSCRSYLEERWCLVVIDGLRSKEDWDLIECNLISGASQSCFIAITREESVAKHCATSADAVCRIKGLDADASHLLFEKTIKPDGSSKGDSNMMDEAELILIDKCGRLPKLIVALAKYLANVADVKREARRLNANFMYGLKTSTGLDSFRDAFTWMYSRFQSCPQLLKKCIFYLSLFTQSSIIRQSRLVRRWIAEGYSEGTDSHSMVEYTEKLIHELVTIGMMETLTKAAGDIRVTSCQVNSLFLDYFISREMEENIFLPLEISVLVQDSSLSTQRAGQHLAIGSSWKRDKFVFESLDFSRLRSLTVSREWKPFFISDRMRVLRVLDLEDTSIKDDDVEQIVQQLPRLKFLSLRRCTKVSCLPELLGGLRQLQTLDIRHTSVTKLPKGISKLQKLQYIRAGTNVVLADEEPSTPRRARHGHVAACHGVTAPKGIEALIALHTLGVVSVRNKDGKAILRELKSLTQLHKLGVSGIDQNNFKALFSAIVGYSKLESLSLQLHMDRDLDWLGKLTPPGSLQRLKMHVHIEKYTHWSCLQALGKVRRLQSLSFHFKTDQDVELQFSDRLDSGTWYISDQFCELKVLQIGCSSNLHVKFSEREMHELEHLKIHCLDGSSLKFSGIEQPPKLKLVWLNGSFDDTVKAELKQKVNLHPNKPYLKLD